MKTVTVDKGELILKVRENRERHRTIFNEAVEGYRVEAVRLLEQHIARIKKGKVAQVYISLPVPQDHTRDYDRVLKMLAMEQRDSVEVTEQDFAQYVLDDWQWKREFLTTASTYNSRTANDALAAEDADD